MKSANGISILQVGVGLLALLAPVPLVQAQHPHQPEQATPEHRGESSAREDHAPKGGPGHAPDERRPSFVDRFEHGSIRHVDTHVVEVPAPAHPDFDARHRVSEHRDVEVDLSRPRFWNGFAFGRRLHVLRAGNLRVLVNGVPYFYDNGIYYQPADDGYQEVYPPSGAAVPELPDDAIAIEAGNITYYYAGGAFYVQQDNGFAVAPPPMGVTVPELPPGAVPVSVNGTLAYQFNKIYYQPVFVDGVTQYMTFMP